ncbi:hypothetical protein [Candidatus Pelagisphaera phototrophica]|uniref:hypothetical protein n=1 Tax=Candidatus Pelagisphaera phototrophica TaxID=2684113 RepID=UPI0019F938BF|nr:hypothetical protein [Candidatus Pelagisphaera phototrophica]QXD31594.1 hypothetical protein GA004_14900 [Candidatus Pelagisphaera phototrophica]
MIALASFAELGDEQLNTLMDNFVVEEEESFVSIGLEYPVESLINILGSLADEGRKAMNGDNEEG